MGHLHTPRPLFMLFPVWNALKDLLECHHSLPIPGRINHVAPDLPFPSVDVSVTPRTALCMQCPCTHLSPVSIC